MVVAAVVVVVVVVVVAAAAAAAVEVVVEVGVVVKDNLGKYVRRVRECVSNVLINDASSEGSRDVEAQRLAKTETWGTYRETDTLTETETESERKGQRERHKAYTQT